MNTVPPTSRPQLVYLVFGADGGVYEADEPVWDEGRVVRAR